jgi:hypothetical protein
LIIRRRVCQNSGFSEPRVLLLIEQQDFDFHMQERLFWF